MINYFSSMKNTYNKYLHKGKFTKFIRKFHNIKHDALLVYNEKDSKLQMLEVALES